MPVLPGQPEQRLLPGRRGRRPAGATVTFCAFYAPPAAGVATVDMELGGFGETVPTPVPH